MMNWIWMGLVMFSILCAGFNDRMQELFKSTFTSAEDAVTLALKLVGGEVRVIATGGLAKLIGPESKYIKEVDNLLTLEGLRILYELNR